MNQIIYDPNCLFLLSTPYCVTSIEIDNRKQLVQITIAKGISIKTFITSMHEAQEIGLINLQALEQLIK